MSKEIVVQVLPWVLSAITVYQVYLSGEIHKYAWVLGIFNQALWLVFIVLTATWGLIPMNVALTAVFVKNHFKWKNNGIQAIQVDRVN